jgi:hypothetical protein
MQDANVRTRTSKTGEGEPGTSSIGSARPKLMDRLREALRSRHYSRRTEQTYCLRHPSMIYTHVLNKGGHGVRSPVDGL